MQTLARGFGGICLGFFASLCSITAFGEEPCRSPPENEFADAIAYCRNYPQSMRLSDDGAVLCFDGPIRKDLDTALITKLNRGGTFVIRSIGGYAISAIEIGNVLADKEAKVVVYDYCFSACASYLLIATAQAFVADKTLIAWHRLLQAASHCNDEVPAAAGNADLAERWKEVCKWEAMQILQGEGR